MTFIQCGLKFGHVARVGFVWSPLSLISEPFPPHCTNGGSRFFFIQVSRYGSETRSPLCCCSGFEDPDEEKGWAYLGADVCVVVFSYLSSWTISWSGRGTTTAKVKHGFTIPFEDLASTDLP